MPEWPTGTVTFFFTDIEGSVRLWELHPVAMRDALARHDAILRAAIENNGGYVFKTVGDAFFSVFGYAPAALRAALEAQRALRDEPWGETGPLKVRMALHIGSAVERGGDYFGPSLSRAQRLLSAAHGGQIVMSLSARELVSESLPEGVDLYDLGKRRLKDLSTTEHVFQVVAPDLPRDFPPLKTLDARPVHLPAPTTSFIGRESEVAAVCGLLRRKDVRLVNLTGPGGVGKTRLALQVAADMADEFEHGVCFVGLSPVVDPGMVVSAIAQTLGVSESVGQVLTTTLIEYIHDRQLLLVLDNFEHVMSASPIIADLLMAARRLKVLVTSREILRIYGEHEYNVPPLELPDLKRLPDLERLRQCAAITLFVERAQAIKPGFELSPDNSRAVSEICARLDGLPLAIELAAARIRLFSPHEMLIRLTNRLALLTSGGKGMPERQRTLRGTIDWSYELLDGHEKRLFARLGVFVGGHTVGAAETVCNADGVLKPDVASVLTSLLEKSLVQPRRGSVDESRFAMLETIREYALERLAEAGEASEIWRRHSDYYLTLAEVAELELRGPDQAEWLERLEREHDNLRAALGWSLQNGQVEKALRLGAALWTFWYWRGYLSEGRMWLEGALATALGSMIPAVVRAKALHGAGMLACAQGDLRRSLNLLEISLELWRELGDKQGLAFVLNGLGTATYNQGDLEQSAKYQEESLALCRELSNKWGIAAALNGLGELARCRGDYTEAQSLYQESLALRRELNNRVGIAVVLHNLGHVAAYQNDYLQAGALFAEALSMAREMGDLQCLAECLTGLAGVLVAEQRSLDAAWLFGAAESLLSAIGASLEPADRAERERHLAAARSAGLDEAAFAAAWAGGRAMTPDQAVEFALERVADA